MTSPTTAATTTPTTTTTPTPANQTQIVLIGGHWLGAWAWDEVLDHLGTAGASAVALTLPGLDEHDPTRTSRTLDEQAAAIASLITTQGQGQPVVLVAHSGANGPVSLVMDQHPDLIARVVWVDSGPVASGSAFAAEVPEDLEELPLPPFEVLGEQASLEGLSPQALARFRSRAVPQPATALRQPVQLTNDARLAVPTTVVCCSIPSTQLMELARAGHPMFAEVARVEHLELVDLPTGHWPMWSRPQDLAELIVAASTRTA